MFYTLQERLSYLLVPRRTFDGVASQDDWPLPKSIKPVLITSPEFDTMSRHVKCLMSSNPPVNIFLMDAYEEVLFTGLSGSVLRPKHWNRHILQEDFMSRVKHIQNEFEHDYTNRGMDTKLTVCPYCPLA